MDGISVLIIIITAILMLAGLVGVVVPFMPGVPLAWLGLLIYAWATGFNRVSGLTVVIFFILMLGTVALDFIAPLLGATTYRASRWGILGAFLGFLSGFSPWASGA